MTIRFSEEANGKVLAVCVGGTLTKADYGQLAPEFERLVQQQGKISVLFDMTDFHGWDAGAAFEDFKLGVKHHAHIERVAMLGDKRWERVMAEFCKPFTRAAIRYFDHGDAAAARQWLQET